MAITVIVTREAVRTGKPDSANNPVAQVLNWQQPVLGAQWHTSLKYAWLSTNSDVRIPLPKNARNLLRLFRNGVRDFVPTQVVLNADRRELARG